uniref:Uncharacterized protein n=1 Tax=Rhizophora mucronata TaxID=61149 RepID=A0A2P2J149_RHIMU
MEKALVLGKTSGGRTTDHRMMKPYTDAS